MIAQAAVRAWDAGGGVSGAQVIAAVRNESAVAMLVRSGDARYQVLDPKGRPVRTGVFTYAVPPIVAPGATTYLAETVAAIFVAPGDIASVDVVAVGTPTDRAGRDLSVELLAWHAGESGLVASGVVSNDTTGPASSVVVAVLFFDEADDLVAALYEPSDAAHIEPGASRRFETSYPDTGPVDPGDIARVEAVAFEVEP